MKGLIEIPIQLITSLSSELAVKIIRDALRAECRYSRLTPSALTISCRLTVADGGIDAEVNSEPTNEIPTDCRVRRR